MRTISIRLFLLFGIVCILFFSFNRCSQVQNNQPEAFFKNLNDTVNYVGMETCKGCHQEHYNNFIQTGMGNSFGSVGLKKSNADFKNIKPIYNKQKNMYYFPYKIGEEIYIKEFRLKGLDTIYQRIEKVSHIIGSGHHTNSHFWNDNGYLFQAPLTWYSQEKKWDMPPGFELNNTRFGRKIDVECMSCHNGMPELLEGALNKFTKLPAGIDCERCHGPGELHVNEKRKGIVVDVKKEADRSIVNPKRLPWKLQVDVCQRCHLQGNNVLKPEKKFTDFRPGMHLDSVFVVYMPLVNNKSLFYMAGHAERLQMSECFIKSNKDEKEAYNPKLNLTCITCHDPHVSVRKTNIQKFNNACINCHNEKGIAALKHCTAPLKDLAQTNQNCVGCHMPANGSVDIPHVTVHDHHIRKPEKSRLIVSGEITPTDLYPVNSKEPNTALKIEALITWFEKFDRADTLLKRAAILAGKRGTYPKLDIHFFYAKNDFKTVFDFSENKNPQNEDAWTCYRIAKSIDKINGPDASLEWYKMACSKFKLHADFNAEYANALLRAKHLMESKLVSEKVLKEQNKHIWSLANLGACETLLGQYALAKKHIMQAISLDPDYASARFYLAELFTRTGELEKAAEQLTEGKKLENIFNYK